MSTEGSKMAERVEMITGWRRFFTRSYWRFQLLHIRMRGVPGDIRGIGTFYPDDPDLADLAMPRESLTRLAKGQVEAEGRSLLGLYEELMEQALRKRKA